jgi:hypothetical protein
MNNGTMEIQFRHPRTAKFLVADLSPQCTGREALQALMAAEDGGEPFLTQSDGEAYSLVHERTSQAITPNMTFAQAGVESGDTIKLDKDMRGAHSNDATCTSGGVLRWRA